MCASRRGSGNGWASEKSATTDARNNKCRCRRALQHSHYQPLELGKRDQGRVLGTEEIQNSRSAKWPAENGGKLASSLAKQHRRATRSSGRRVNQCLCRARKAPEEKEGKSSFPEKVRATHGRSTDIALQNRRKSFCMLFCKWPALANSSFV